MQRTNATNRRSLTACAAVALVTVLLSAPATADTQAEPDIADVAGDANAVSSVTGVETDTRPLSFGNADIRAVWFETAYATSKFIDPATGEVSRVEHRPTALVVRIQTEAAVRPLDPWGALRFKIGVTVPACQATLDLLVATNPAFDSAEIRPATAGSTCEGLTIAVSPFKPTYDGAVATLAFPLTHPQVAQILSAGTLLDQTSALVLGTGSAGPSLPTAVDDTAAGRSFTIGQDVPPDVECSDEPAHEDCQP